MINYIQKARNLERAILRLLEEERTGLTRPEIVEKLDISWSRAYDRLVWLESNNLVYRRRSRKNNVGRPKIYWVFHRNELDYGNT